MIDGSLGWIGDLFIIWSPALFAISIYLVNVHLDVLSPLYVWGFAAYAVIMTIVAVVSTWLVLSVVVQE